MALYTKEQELIPHYDGNPTYYSSPASILFDRVGINVEGKVCLDLGCGDGRACFNLLKRGADFVSGVDYSRVRIDIANKQAEVECVSDRASFACDNLHDYLDAMIETNTKVDLICMFEVLEHLEDPKAVLEKANRAAYAVCGSVPIRHEYVAHLQVFPHIDDIVKLVGKDAVFTVAEGHVFFYRK